MSGPTQPLSPPEVMEFSEKARAILAGVVLGVFLIVVVLWTFHAPQLPGDVAGMIVGAIISVMGAMGSYYWGSIQQKK